MDQIPQIPIQETTSDMPSAPAPEPIPAPTPPPLPLSTTPKPKRSLPKISAFGLVCLFALIVSFGALAYFFLQNQTLKNQLGLPSLKIPHTQKTCDYNGQTYKAGQGFQSTDGCNSCSCSENGEVACTEMACMSDDEVTQTDPTANWKTYTSMIGYSIKVPSGTSISETDTENSRCSTIAVGEINLIISDMSDGKFCGTSGSDTPTRQTKTDYSFTVLGNEYKDVILFEFDSPTKSTLYKLLYSVDIGKNLRLEISGNYSTKAEKQSFENSIMTINQILSTFEFNDQDQTHSTDTWKTFTNTTYSYSFKYPNDWELNLNKTAGKVHATLNDLQQADYVSIFMPELSKLQLGNGHSSGAEISISTLVNTPGGEILTNCETITDQSCLDKLLNLFNTYNYSVVQVDGYDALKLESQSTLDYTDINTYIKMNGTIYSISLIVQNAPNPSKSINDYTQILSTFEFTK